MDDELSGVPYFAPLTPDERAKVRAMGVRRRVAAGATLFVEGEPCAGLFVVASGSVKLFKTSAEGKEQILRYMPAGESFNEVPVFDGGPNPVSAAVVDAGEVLVFPQRTVEEIMRGYPAVREAVVRVLASRLRHLVTLVEDLSFRQVTARVARVVLQSVAPHEGVGAGAGERERVTQREIAQMAGTSREVVARALKALEDAGAIRVHQGEITVVDQDKLTALS
jgi:CRP/FNR family transcriptional regulator